MYIKKMNIQNIRSYKKATLEFSPGINLILGPNNSGKSTILRCIQALQQHGYFILKDDIRKNSYIGRFHFQISDITKPYYDTFYIIGHSDSKEKDILFVVLENTEPRKLLGDDRYHKIVFNEYLDIEKMHPSHRDADAFVGFSAKDGGSNYIYPFLSKRKTSQFSGYGGREAAFGIDPDLRNLPAKIQNLSNGTHPFHEEFVKHCNDILGFQIAKVPGNSNSNNEDKLGIFATTSQTIFLESMGEGVANILGLLTILLTEDGKLFLIEEIENDIHPESLKKLLDLILEKSKTNQFIISTHSNIVLKYLATAPDAKVFYTDWSIETDKKNRTNLPTTTISEIENTPLERLRILEKLGYDLFDFDLYKSYIILEESSAESIIKNFLIPEFVPELINKVKTIAANGTSDLPPRFDDFLRLFVFIHNSPLYYQRAWVIADGEESGKHTISKLKEKFPNWTEDHFINFSKDDFEEFYPDEFRTEFLSIKSLPDKKERWNQKRKLTEKVMNWINSDKGVAKEAFKETANEVITLLQKISLSLTS